MTRIKACGIMNQLELAQAISAGVDAVGFVVEIDDSRHCLSVGEATNLIRMVPVYTKSVAVIAPENVDEAASLAIQIKPDVLQIHGSLEPGDLAELRKRIPQKLVAAIPARLEDALLFSSFADAILLDTAINGKLGGTGEVHDWNHSSEISKRLKVPVILAGGLNPGNVSQAIIKVRPYAVDVSSGIETNGKKDPEKIRSFVREVRSCPQ